MLLMEVLVAEFVGCRPITSGVIVREVKEKTTTIKSADSYTRWFTREGLKEVFIRDVLGRDVVGKDRMTGSVLNEIIDDELSVILRKVHDGSYRFADYRQVLILKGANKHPREICIPTARDALVLAALKEILKESMGPKCQTPKPQSVIEDLRRAVVSRQYNHFIKIDISEYYKSIKHEMLVHILQHYMWIRKPQVLQLVQGAITTPSTPMGAKRGKPRASGLPEGLSISNLLANAYLVNLDKDCERNTHIFFARYVDDIIVLCESAYAKKAVRFVIDRLNHLGLRINKEKMQEGSIGIRQFEYLGYVFDGDRLDIRTTAIRRIEQRLESLLKQYSRSNSKEQSRIEFELRLVITGCIWQQDENIQQKLGWVMYYSQASDCGCFARLDHTVKRIDARLGAGIADSLPKFVRVYHETKYRISTTSYIPRLGYNTPIDKKRSILRELGLAIDDHDDEWIERVFSNRIRRLCRKLERDVGGVS